MAYAPYDYGDGMSMLLYLLRLTFDTAQRPMVPVEYLIATEYKAPAPDYSDFPVCLGYRHSFISQGNILLSYTAPHVPDQDYTMNRLDIDDIEGGLLIMDEGCGRIISCGEELVRIFDLA